MTKYVGELLSQAFPHLQAEQLEVIIKGFFAYDNNPAMFKSHLRDFLVQCKVRIVKAGKLLVRGLTRMLRAV